MYKHFIRPLNLLAGTTAALALAACGGGNDNGAAAAPAAKGTVAASVIADAPACGLDAFNVTITKLRFRQDANTDPAAPGWTEVTLSPARKLNLLYPSTATSGSAIDLGSLDLPAGLYTQMALVLDPNNSGAANTVRVAGSTAEVPLETAASVAAGVVVPLDLNVQANQKANVVFDFEACNAFQMRGATYVLKPRPHLALNYANGIGGFIDKAALASNIVITAQKGGTIVATTVPNANTGEFVLPRLAPDNYDLVVQGNGRLTYVVGTVPVPASGVTSVSTATAPLTLATSTVNSIAGTVSFTAPAVAPPEGTYVVASQAISATPAAGTTPAIPATTVTFRTQTIDLGNGNYTFTNLPRSVPMYAPYSSKLPLTFVTTTTSGGAGRYRVEGFASGYVNKTSASANINISSASATGVNIVFP
jgi:hypothetical protein